MLSNRLCCALLLASLPALHACAGKPQPAPPYIVDEPRSRPAQITPLKGSEAAKPRIANTPASRPALTRPSEFRDKVKTSLGRYWVYYKLPNPLPVGDSYALELWVEPAQATSQSNLSVAVDAAMPHHRHGMNVAPRVKRLPDGRYRVKPLRFHMPGRWHLYIDVTEGAFTERAELIVEI